MELTHVLSIVSLLGTVSSIFFAFLAFRRNESHDNVKEGKSEGVLISDVGYIKSSIDRMEKTIEKVEERYHELLTRIIKLEQSVQSAHKRIDEKNKH